MPTVRDAIVVPAAVLNATFFASGSYEVNRLTSDMKCFDAPESMRNAASS